MYIALVGVKSYIFFIAIFPTKQLVGFFYAVNFPRQGYVFDRPLVSHQKYNWMRSHKIIVYFDNLYN